MSAARFEPYVVPDVAAGMLWACGASVTYSACRKIMTAHGDLNPEEAAVYAWATVGAPGKGGWRAGNEQLRRFIYGATGKLEPKTSGAVRDAVIAGLQARCIQIAALLPNPPERTDIVDQMDLMFAEPVVRSYLARRSTEPSFRAASDLLPPVGEPTSRHNLAAALASIPIHRLGARQRAHVALLQTLIADDYTTLTREAGALAVWGTGDRAPAADRQRAVDVFFEVIDRVTVGEPVGAGR